MSSDDKTNEAKVLKAYRLSLFSFAIFLTTSVAWFSLLGVGRGAGASWALLYPFLAFLLASVFNFSLLVWALKLAKAVTYEPTARKAVWISIGSGIMPAFCIFFTFDNSPLRVFAIGLFLIYGFLAIRFDTIRHTK